MHVVCVLRWTSKAVWTGSTAATTQVSDWFPAPYVSWPQQQQQQQSFSFTQTGLVAANSIAALNSCNSSPMHFKPPKSTSSSSSTARWRRTRSCRWSVTTSDRKRFRWVRTALRVKNDFIRKFLLGSQTRPYDRNTSAQNLVASAVRPQDVLAQRSPIRRYSCRKFC